MSISSIASQHGLAFARVAAESDDYARLVRSSIGLRSLLALIMSYSTSVQLREVFVPILRANRVRIINGDSSGMDTARNIFAALDDLCTNPPSYRLITSRFGRDFYVIADSNVNLDHAIQKALFDSRLKTALEESDIADDVNDEIERLKRTGLI
jgi:hypothetical protein